MAVIRFHLTLIKMAGERKELIVDAQEPIRLTAILEGIGVPQQEVGIIVRNRKSDEIDCVIHNGDVVELFPAISGG